MTNSSLADSDSTKAAALDFHRQAAQQISPAIFALFSFADLVKTYDLETEYELFIAKANEIITGLGWGTDLDTLADAYQEAQSTMAFWSGTYRLIDSENNQYDLIVSDDGATIVVGNGNIGAEAVDDWLNASKLNKAIFDDGALTVKNDKMTFSLHFAIPFSIPGLLDGSTPSTDVGGSVRCNGSLIISDASGARRLSVMGKLGSFTMAGIQQATSGDPAKFWTGKYILQDYTDPMAVRQLPDMLDIGLDDSGLRFTLGTHTVGNNIQFFGNALTCTDEADTNVSYKGRFVCELDGNRLCHIQRISPAGIAYYRAIWVEQALDVRSHPIRAATMLTRDLAATTSTPAFSLAWPDGWSEVPALITVPPACLLISTGYTVTVSLPGKNPGGVSVTYSSCSVSGLQAIGGGASTATAVATVNTAVNTLSIVVSGLSATDAAAGGISFTWNCAATVGNSAATLSAICTLPIATDPQAQITTVNLGWPANWAANGATPFSISLPQAAVGSDYQINLQFSNIPSAFQNFTIAPASVNPGPVSVAPGQNGATLTVGPLTAPSVALSLLVTCGSATFTLNCSIAVQTFPTIVVNPVSLTSLNPLQGSAFEVTIKASGGNSQFAYDLSDSLLPSTVSISGHKISGTPTVTGSYNVAGTVYPVGVVMNAVPFSLPFSVNAPTGSQTVTNAANTVDIAIAAGVVGGYTALLATITAIIVIWKARSEIGKLEADAGIAKDNLRIAKDKEAEAVTAEEIAKTKADRMKAEVEVKKATNDFSKATTLIQDSRIESIDTLHGQVNALAEKIGTGPEIKEMAKTLAGLDKSYVAHNLDGDDFLKSLAVELRTISVNTERARKVQEELREFLDLLPDRKFIDKKALDGVLKGDLAADMIEKFENSISDQASANSVSKDTCKARSKGFDAKLKADMRQQIATAKSAVATASKTLIAQSQHEAIQKSKRNIDAALDMAER